MVDCSRGAVADSSTNWRPSLTNVGASAVNDEWWRQQIVAIERRLQASTKNGERNLEKNRRMNVLTLDVGIVHGGPLDLLGRIWLRLRTVHFCGNGSNVNKTLLSKAEISTLKTCPGCRRPSHLRAPHDDLRQLTAVALMWWAAPQHHRWWWAHACAVLS